MTKKTNALEELQKKHEEALAEITKLRKKLSEVEDVAQRNWVVPAQIIISREYSVRCITLDEAIEKARERAESDYSDEEYADVEIDVVDVREED